MRVDALPSPGFLSNAACLRREAAKAISTVEIQNARSGGNGSSNARQLVNFFSDCMDAAGNAGLTAAPFIRSAVATSSTTLKLTFDGSPMDHTVKPGPSAFTSTGNTITATAWGTGGDDGKLILTGTGFAASDSLVYTKPATNFLRSVIGIPVASETQAIT